MSRTGSIVRPATPGDYNEIAALLDRTFGNRPYARRLALWKWRYDDNPARTDAFPSFLVIEEKGRIVGAHGLIPLRVKAGNRELLASCSCDLAVDPAARSAGMKLKLAALARELSPLHLSTSANEPANKITMALGGREVSSGRKKFLKPLKASGLMRRGLDKNGPASGFVAVAGTAIWKPADWLLAAGRAARFPNRVAGSQIRDIPFFDDRYDRFWERLSGEQVVLVVRDSSYLNWRYGAYPFTGIQSFELVRGDRLLGFAAIHLAVDEDRLRFAAILDLAGQPGENGAMEHLLEEAIRRAASAGAHYVIARSPAPGCGQLFRRLGFRERAMGYSPVTFKNNSDVPDGLFAEDGNWYVTLGDGDGCHYFPEEGDR